MSEETRNPESEKLNRLFEYTKFHIGLYTAIVAVFAGLVGSKEKIVFVFDIRWLIVAVVFMCVAGAAGGVLMSSMCHANSMSEFWNSRLGPLWFKWWRAETWTYIEHIAFWIAIACALIAFLMCPLFNCT